MVLIPANPRARSVVAVVAAAVLAATVAAQNPHAAESKPALAAQTPSPAETKPGPVLGPVYPKQNLYPAKKECGETQVMTAGGPVMTPRQGWYISQCRLITVYGSDGKVLSQQEQCGPPTFAKCS